MNLEDRLARGLLRGAVQQRIFSEQSGKVLDVKSAVLAEIHFRSGNVKDLVVTADEWDSDVSHRLEQTRQHPSVERVDVYDGRKLFARQ